MTRTIILATIATVSLFPLAQAEEMSEEARTKALEQLNVYLDNATSEANKAINAAIAKLESVVNDTKKLKEFLKETYKKDAENDGKKYQSDPEEWKERGFERALQIQCQWAIISLRATAKDNEMKAQGEKFDPTVFASNLQSFITGTIKEYRDAKTGEDLSKCIATLRGDLLRGPFGKVYNVGNARPSSWPSNPLDINGVFNVVMKYPRESKDVKLLRKAWDDRITLEAVMSETNEESVARQKERDTMRSNMQKVIGGSAGGGRAGMMGGGGPGGGGRGGANAPVAATTVLKDKEQLKKPTPQAMENINRLRWQREIDCFNIGDEVVAFRNLAALVKEEIVKARQLQLAEELKRLIMRAKNEESEAEGGAEGNAPNATGGTGGGGQNGGGVSQNGANRNSSYNTQTSGRGGSTYDGQQRSSGRGGRGGR